MKTYTKINETTVSISEPREPLVIKKTLDQLKKEEQEILIQQIQLNKRLADKQAEIQSAIDAGVKTVEEVKADFIADNQ